LGAELQEMGAVSAGDVADLPLSALETKLGAQRARWVADAVRGVDGEAVVPKGPPKSMLAAKSFSATADMAAIQRWLGILADELAARMAQDEVAHKRRAR
jgi:nucleotidyltransferase/DNA polymerase involved in DNA repair